ncbi:MAG: hypothetical protein U9P79_06660 [Candidatus Cloacimonadota bacterium]|nr:hypothetical protein [Candidatus Cloacimonadota bacterium]
MKKLAWISGIIAAILMLFGFIDFLMGHMHPFLHVTQPQNYFIVAISFLLFTIVFLIYPEKKD